MSTQAQTVGPHAAAGHNSSSSNSTTSSSNSTSSNNSTCSSNSTGSSNSSSTTRSNATAAEGSGAAASVCSGPQVVFVLGGPGAGKGTQCELLAKRMNLVHISAGDCLREERNRPGSEHGELIERYIREGNIVPVEITMTLLLKKMLASGWNRKILIDGFPRNDDNLSGWKRFTDRENLKVKLQQIKQNTPALAPQCELALQQLLLQEEEQKKREEKQTQQQQVQQGKKEEGKEEKEEEDINADSGIPVCFCLYLDCPEGALEQRLLRRGEKSQRSDDNATAIRKRMVTFNTETLPIVKYFERQHKVRHIDASAPVDDVWKAVAALFEHLPQSPSAE